MKLPVLFALVPMLATADPLETDFDQVFEDNAAMVVVQDGVSSIELDERIMVSRKGDGDVLALDGSPFEAVGCVLQITLQSAAVGALCPASIAPEQLETLDRNLQQLGEFYAANNVPAAPVAAVQSSIAEAKAALVKRLENLDCQMPEVDTFVDFVGTLTSDEAQARLSENLATARLPVTNPCL